MAAVVADEVIVALEARLGRYTANVANAERHFDRSMRNIQGAATRTEARVASAFRNMAGAVGLTVGTAGVVLAARQFLQYADAAKNLEAQLRLATRQSGSFAQAQEDVRRIAAQTRSGLEETATLYATFQRNARELGITQQQAARATQTVTEAFLISGASAAEAAGGLRQFLQGIQSGTLRGEELNSVLENAPRLARLLADSLDVTIGRLRAMGQEGELSGQKLMRALTDRQFTDQIDEEFRQLPVTFEQAMTLVNNAAIETFGAFDRGGRFSEALVNFITGGTDGMEDIANAAEQAGIEIRAAFEGLTNVFDPLWQAATSVFGDISGQAVNLRNLIADIGGAMDSLAGIWNRAAAGGRFGVVTMLNQQAPGLPWNRWLPPATPVGGNAREGALRRYDEASGRSRRRGQDDATARRSGAQVRDGRTLIDQEFLRYLNEPGRYDFFGRALNPSRPSPAASGTRRRRRGRKGPSAETLARQAEAERVRALREEQQFQAELASLNEDLLAARQAMVTAAEAIAAFEIQQIEAARDRQNQAYRDEAEREPEGARRELARVRAAQLVEANNAVAAERVRAVQLREQNRIDEERVQLASAELDNAIELEQAQGALAATADERRASALRLLDLQQQQERLELEGLVQLHGLNDIRGKEAQARLDALDAIYQARRQGVMNEHLSVRDRYLADLRLAGQTMNDQLDQVAIDGFERLNDELAETVGNFLQLGGVAGRVLNQIITDLARLAIQRAIIGPLANAFFGAVGGGGGAGSIVSKALTGGSGNAPWWTGPGWATGGSTILGGRAGVDQNLLSLNGAPLARVSRGEKLTVSPQGKVVQPVSGPAAMLRPHITVISAPQFDLRGMIGTKALFDEVQRVSQVNAAQAAAAMGKGVLAAVPGRLSQFQSDGT